MDRKGELKAVSMTNTKQEILDAYQETVKKLQEKEAVALKPEKKMEEKKAKEAVATAESLVLEGVSASIGLLKSDVVKALAQISDRLEEEVRKFVSIREAIGVKEKELQEVYEIEKTALTLAALIETHHEKRQEFEGESEGRREALKRDIAETRSAWEKEKEAFEAAAKERDVLEKKRQVREKEEFEYAFKKDRQQVTDRFETEKAKLEKDLKIMREEAEKGLAAREAAVADREQELAALRDQAAKFPGDLEKAVQRAVKEATEKILLESRMKESLAKKEYEGEKNVFITRVDSLETQAKEQAARIAALTGQIEAAYQKVQDMAVKTVEGASSMKALSGLQQVLGEHLKKQGQEK